MMIIVISDDGDLTEAHQQIIRKLRAQHEMLWVSVADSAGFDKTAAFYELDNRFRIPAYISASDKLAAGFQQAEEQRLAEYSKALERMGIVYQRIDGDEQVVSGLFKLLERKKRARKS